MTVSNAEIQTGSSRTFYNRSGAGQAETILFLHGSGPGVTAWSNWQLALPFFDDKFDCLAPDLVGFGATEHPADPPTTMRGWMRLWVDQCLALLDALDIGQAHLVGNSMGGAIALHLLMEAPQRFNRVVLMGSIGAPHTITPEIDRLWGFYEDPSIQAFGNVIRWFVYDDAFLADRIESITKARFEAAMDPDVRRSFMAMFPAPRQKVLDDLVVPALALRRLAQPILLVHGRDDRIVPLETSLHLLQHLPNVQLHVFGQCSHWTQIEFASSFNQLLAQFFTGQL
ncbi:MAG: alpha/beta fold hydrolase [Chloroflexi bacterium]|nr:alpha/beta fold hydrolase [Chloroflexota bacterium]MCI0576302.1 alpha/beta fold hydrolase [Chloroflexota bacterium]MCI0650029.1 alpha/beta fold hydrolase [Chloroflexota bacterium]MCI0730487.1 alpha/beta fold hydrolase [Chloroflexota bacterium]